MTIKDMELLQHNVGKQEKKKKLMYEGKSNVDSIPRSKREISDSSKLSFLSEVLNILPKATLNVSVSLPQCENIPPSLEDIAAYVT